MPLSRSLPDVPKMPDPGLYELLQAMRRLTLENAAQLAGGVSGSGGDTIVIGGGGGSTPGLGVRDPPSFYFDFGLVLENYAANAAEDMYVREGQYPTTRPQNQWPPKAMGGRGQFLGPDYAAPANYGYMTAKPETWPSQGRAGWFRGDQWFTDGGEWKTLGPLVRTYDVAARYFESNTIPHHAWFDILSGNSGIAAYITAGVTPGNSVTLPFRADPEWVGKQVQIKPDFGSLTILATLTVASVSGNTVTFTTSHAVTCPWNPSNPVQRPNLSFAPRTWGGHQYLLVRSGGGGDNYGTIIRQVVSYQPKPNELVHTFNGATAGQTGGSVDFQTFNFTLTSPASTASAVLNVTPDPTLMPWPGIVGRRLLIRNVPGGPPIDARTVLAITSTTITLDQAPLFNYPTANTQVSVGPDGTYATGWESIYSDQGSDVSVIAQVDSFNRANDRADQGGRVWLGTLMKSEGVRTADAAHVVLGPWRRGVDLVRGAFNEGSYLTAAASSGATTVQVKWPTGARAGGTIVVRNGVTSTHTATISGVSGNLVSFSPGLNAAYPDNSIVDFIGGGAAISLASGQKVNWDASVVNANRGGDPLNIWSPLYGNTLGSIWSGAGSDGGGIFWQLDVAAASLRLRPAGLNVSVPVLGNNTIAAAEDVISNGSTVDGNFSGCFVFSSGSGEHIGFNTSTQKFEFYRNFTLVGSIPA